MDQELRNAFGAGLDQGRKRVWDREAIARIRQAEAAAAEAKRIATRHDMIAAIIEMSDLVNACGMRFSGGRFVPTQPAEISKHVTSLVDPLMIEFPEFITMGIAKTEDGYEYRGNRRYANETVSRVSTASRVSTTALSELARWLAGELAEVEARPPNRVPALPDEVPDHKTERTRSVIIDKEPPNCSS